MVIGRLKTKKKINVFLACLFIYLLFYFVELVRDITAPVSKWLLWQDPEIPETLSLEDSVQ